MNAPPAQLAPSTLALRGRKMRWWYEHLADYMIAHPTARQNDIAAFFKRAPSTISIIINSDAFKAYLRQRRADYTDGLDTAVQQKMLNVADKSFDMILERFEKKRDSIPLGDLFKAVELTQKVAEKSGPTVVVNNAPQVAVPVAVSLEDLENARMALRAAQAPPMIDVTPTPEEAASPRRDSGSFDASDAEDLA